MRLREVPRAATGAPGRWSSRPRRWPSSWRPRRWALLRLTAAQTTPCASTHLATTDRAPRLLPTTASTANGAHIVIRAIIIVIMGANGGLIIIIVPIRKSAPLDSIPLAAARTEEQTILAVPATPGSIRRPLGRASAPAATPGSTRRQQEPRRVPAPCVLLANTARLDLLPL